MSNPIYQQCFKWAIRFLYASLLVFLSVFILRNFEAIKEFEFSISWLPLISAFMLIIISYTINCWLWLHFAKIDFGPVFVRTSRDGKRALETRLNDKHVARLIKRTVLDAGIRSELPEKDRLALFSGHSLRAGLASSAEVDERYVQKQLGHASAEMTRRYQRRRDRFRVNLTKAAGL